MTPTEAMELAVDNILSQLKDLDAEYQKVTGRRSENLYISQSRLIHFKMELLDEEVE
jgi:RecA/RadA recombinase